MPHQREEGSWWGALTTLVVFLVLLGIGVKYFGLGAFAEPFVHNWRAWLAEREAPRGTSPLVSAPKAAETEKKQTLGGIWRRLQALLLGEREQARPASAEQRGPRVLILQAHSSECYTPKTSHAPPGGEPGDIVRVGAELAKALEAQGIPTLQLKTRFDVPVYREAYERARAAIVEILKKNPSIELILDLHRDGMAQGAEVYRGEIKEKGRVLSLARLYLVAPVLRESDLATQSGGKTAQEWAGALYQTGTRLYPGLIRGIGEKQLLPGPEMADPRALQVYWGDFQATSLQEALASVSPFAEVVAAVLQEKKKQ